MAAGSNARSRTSGWQQAQDRGNLNALYKGAEQFHLNASGLTVGTNIVNSKVQEAGVAAYGGNVLNLKRVAHYTWTFAANGGTFAGITFTGPALPQGALVIDAYYYVKTAPTGTTNASIQLLGANDIVTAAAISGAPWSTAATARQGTLTKGTATTWLITTNATTKPVLVGTVADFTAGAIELWLEYVLIATP